MLKLVAALALTGAVILVSIAAPRTVRGQPQQPPDYLPLEVGNWWRQAYVETHFSPPDTIPVALHEVLDEVEVEDRSYFRLSRHLLDADLVRSDSLGRIWGYRRGDEHLLLDFTASHDSIYFYPYHDYRYEVHVSRDRTVQTLAGSFSNCVSFFFDIPEAVDDETSYTFAPEIGLIAIGGAWEHGTLHSAKVGGAMIVTAIEEDRPGRGLSARVYPVPVLDRAQLELETAWPGLVTVSVYDVLGRRLATDRIALVSAGHTSHIVDLTRFAAGIYVFVIRHENGQAQAVMVPRP